MSASSTPDIEKRFEEFKNYIESKMENMVEKHTREIQELKDVIDAQGKHIQKLEADNDVKNTTTKELQKKLENIQGLVGKTRDGSKVAFFASVTNNLKILGENQDIVFDNAVTNIGNGYFPRRGLFVAPLAGTYVFSVTLKVSGPSKTWGHFVVNGSTIAKLEIDHQQSSQTIIVDLRKGGDVSVQNTVPNRGIFGDRYSTFSGYLLYEDDTVHQDID